MHGKAQSAVRQRVRPAWSQVEPYGHTGFATARSTVQPTAPASPPAPRSVTSTMLEEPQTDGGSFERPQHTACATARSTLQLFVPPPVPVTPTIAELVPLNVISVR